MNRTTRQSGFHVIELALVLVVMGLIGVVGYKVMHSRSSNNNVANTTQSLPSAPAISQTKDLDTASSTIDELDTSTTNLNELSSLEQELNAL